MGLYRRLQDRGCPKETRLYPWTSLSLLFAFAGVPLCLSGGSSDVNAECIRLAPHFLPMNQREALCRQATTAAPSECAKKARSATRLSGSHILELCSGVLSDLPGQCVARLSRSATKELSPDLRVKLCKDARSDVPAQCVEHSAKTKRNPELVVDVCKGALSVAPAECLDSLPKNISHEAALSLCGRAQGVGPALCANARGQLSQGTELTASLCRGASGQGPADCFRRSAGERSLSSDERVQLCRLAKTDDPARCAGRIRDRRISPAQKVALCRGAFGAAPATCFASTPPSMLTEDRVALCQGAAEENPTASAACLKAMPQDFPSTVAVALCRGGSDSRAAAECVKMARHIIGDSSDDLLILCRGASSAAPAHCAKAAFRVGAERHLAIILCSGSMSLAPASCFAAAPRQIPAAVLVETCTGAQSTSPALCLEACMPRGLRLAPDHRAVCPLDPEAGSVPRRGIDYRLAARLCRDAPDDSPAQCARAAPLRMSDDDVEVLCAAEGLPQGEDTAKCGMAALMVGFSSASAASLCRGAGSSAPSACAATAAHRLGEDMRLTVCKGASNNAPARCANSLSIGRAPSASEIAACREAVPLPSGLHITSLGHNGDTLYPDQPMHATLEIWDQWGGVIHSDNSTIVRASIAVRGSNGAVANSNGRFNTSCDGAVHFTRLSFSGSGDLTLQFSIDSGHGTPIPSAAARIIVAETERGAIIRRCRGVFRRLACPRSPEGEEGTIAASEGDAALESRSPRHHPPLSVSTETVSTVSGGAAAASYVMSCQGVLEENGMNVAYVSSPGTGGLAALLWYHPGIEALETGVGLPTRDLPPWERLGVHPDASAREVRRAYYRQSLLWHPDRWVRYAMHSARAQDVFETVSDAYAWMAGNLAAGGEKDPQSGARRHQD